MDKNINKSSGLVGQRAERLEKLAKLKKLGINPFPAKVSRTHVASSIHDSYSELEGQNVTVAGRVVSIREHGHLAFIDLADASANIQLYLRSDSLAEHDKSKQLLGFEQLYLLDSGDFLEAKGEVVKTKSGEKSILVRELRIITKSLRPLPEKWQGVQDKETRFRRRYLDLATNPEVAARFRRKARFWQLTRDFLNQKGFIELNTPVLEHRTGGADATPFVTHHNDLDQDLYLRISTELPLKRAIGGGFEKIYSIGPNFRNEGLSDEHLQEYQAIEWYWAYANYKDNIKLVKELFIFLANEIYGKTEFETREHKFDLAGDWQEIDYAKIILQEHGVDIFSASEQELLSAVEQAGIKLTGEINRNRLIDNLWKAIRKTIAGPAVLINEPKFMSPLAKSKPENGELTERYHIVIAGSELANGYSEINDPIDQLDRFIEQEELREAGDDEAQMLDIDFVEMLEYGMPPTSGHGHSERLFWYFEDITAREGTLFPLLKEHLDETTKKIYGDIVKSNSKPIKNDTNQKDLEYPSFDQAEKLMLENVSDDYQRLHAYMVAKVMEGYAIELGEEQAKELWAITGLIHDWDYGFDPQGHPEQNIDKLRELGYPELVCEAILAHKPSLGEPRTSKMASALLAIDELVGLLYAYNKFKGGYENMKPKSVMKKFKDKAFAAKVNRDDIKLGLEDLGIDVREHIEKVLRIMTTPNPRYDAKLTE